MKPFSRNVFLGIVIALICAKLFVCSFSFEYDSKDRIIYSSATSKFKTHFYYGGDDYEVVNSAVYYRNTGQILTDSPLHSFIKPRFRSQKPYLTAFRPKAFIYTHYALITIYNFFSGHTLDVPDSPYLKEYLNDYGMLLYLITGIIFSLSVYFFYKTLLLLKVNLRLSQIGTMGYILIPSLFIFIGSFDSWENIAVCCQVIIFYFILADWKGLSHKFLVSFAASLLVLSALYRPHLLMSYAALFSFVLLVFLVREASKDKWSISLNNIRTVILGGILLVLFHIPIFIQNHHYFGSYFLSTQSQFEFFQGHNKFARSSWNSGIYLQNKDYFDSVFKSKNIRYLNEYQEAQLYGNIAKDWMKANPKQEIFLDIKKVAGYFLPYNHLNNQLNIYTLLLEIGFLLFVILFLINLFSKSSTQEERTIDFLIIIPVLMTILLTVIFFVGYRWRYYAEPFFLLMTILIIDRYKKIVLNGKRAI